MSVYDRLLTIEMTSNSPSSVMRTTSCLCSLRVIRSSYVIGDHVRVVVGTIVGQTIDGRIKGPVAEMQLQLRLYRDVCGMPLEG